MSEKRVTFIISDLHVGDGTGSDDFVDHNQQLAGFLKEQESTQAGRSGDIELIINGDFLEFVQVYPEGYTLQSSEFWCSEQESEAKLTKIINGHGGVFETLARFVKAGNRVTVFPGNHDVDLCWPAVQKAIRGRVPGVLIEKQQLVYKRYGGRLQISHGHLFPDIDPANGFVHWQSPVLDVGANGAAKRLEMCPGTLFVVRFVNAMEKAYPFADNLHPATSLISILRREDRWGLAVLSWSMTKFAWQYPNAFLSTQEVGPDVGASVLQAIRTDPIVQQRLAGLYGKVLGRPAMTADAVKQSVATEEALASLVAQLLQTGHPWEEWLEVFDETKPAVLSTGSHDSTLSIMSAGNVDVRAACKRVAEKHWREGAEVFVLGHTHLPETATWKGASGSHVYYNPGSWTRYVENAGTLTLEQLRDESRFPYELNYVRVENSGGKLKSEMLCIDKFP
jgi:UDP-2,3-diacylglucosamine pyrophosphatase LpxH